MKDRPILILTMVLTLIVEMVLMILVYKEVGNERLPIQIGRLIVQIALIIWILYGNSNLALFLLVAYHILSALFGLYSSGSSEIIGQILIGYHLLIGVIMYFHDWIENKFGLKNVG